MRLQGIAEVKQGSASQILWYAEPPLCSATWASELTAIEEPLQDRTSVPNPNPGCSNRLSHLSKLLYSV